MLHLESPVVGQRAAGAIQVVRRLPRMVPLLTRSTATSCLTLPSSAVSVWPADSSQAPRNWPPVQVVAPWAIAFEPARDAVATVEDARLQHQVGRAVVIDEARVADDDILAGAGELRAGVEEVGTAVVDDRAAGPGVERAGVVDEGERQVRQRDAVRGAQRAVVDEDRPVARVVDQSRVRLRLEQRRCWSACCCRRTGRRSTATAWCRC